jgi:hypothetical protein
MRYFYPILSKFSDERGGSDTRNPPLDPPMRITRFWYINFMSGSFNILMEFSLQDSWQYFAFFWGILYKIVLNEKKIVVFNSKFWNINLSLSINIYIFLFVFIWNRHCFHNRQRMDVCCKLVQSRFLVPLVHHQYGVFTRLTFTLTVPLLFCVPLKNFPFIWRRHHYEWRAAKFRLMLGALGLWAGRDLYGITPLQHKASVFPVSSKGPTPFSCLLRHIKGCWRPILTRILTGPHSVASYEAQGDAKDLFKPGSSFSHLLLQAKGWWRFILTRVLTGPNLVAFCCPHRDVEDLF